MDRRRFLRLLGAASAGMALDPERALWVPGAKRIFLPPVRPQVITLTRAMAATIMLPMPHLFQVYDVQAAYNRMASQMAEAVKITTWPPTVPPSRLAHRPST